MAKIRGTYGGALMKSVGFAAPDCMRDTIILICLRSAIESYIELDLIQSYQSSPPITTVPVSHSLLIQDKMELSRDFRCNISWDNSLASSSTHTYMRT